LFSDDDESGRFVSCHYEYCHTLVYEPELIDGLYCSLTCKNIEANKMTVIDESDIDAEKNTNRHTKSVVKQNNFLSKLEDKIHKRKQSFTTPCPEKMARNNDPEYPNEHHTNNICSEISLDENESSESLSDKSVSDQIKTTEVEDEDMIFDLKVFFLIFIFYRYLYIYIYY